MKSEMGSNLQKKIADYVISYCPSEYYGKNIHGEIRAGYKIKDNKIVVFRIVPLPLTPPLAAFLQLQRAYSGLSGYARSLQDPLHSSSNHYVPLEYFPKTFHSERALFKTNAKYMDEYVEKFLRVYAFFYNMRVTHGNLTARNIGITFEGKVKLMDFALPSEELAFEARAVQDYADFRQLIAEVLEKDDNFPAKFSCFNCESAGWEQLFSLWHVTSPLEPLYLPRKGRIQNAVTLMHKLSLSLEEDGKAPALRLALRLLMLQQLQASKEEELLAEAEVLRGLVGTAGDHERGKLNAVVMGAIRDPGYYGLSAEQRLILICCLVPVLNHEYALFEIAQEFASEEHERNRLLGDSLLATYRPHIYAALLPD